MISHRRLILAPALLILGLSACAPIPDWVRADASPSQTRSDYYACRNEAQRTSRDYEGNGSDPFRTAERQSEAKRTKGQIAACMLDKGYLPGK